MKKRIEKYFPAALLAIKTVLQKDPEGKPIDKEYQGYISAFGASVMQMGLLPTLAVHDDKGSDSAKDRRALLEVLARTLAETKEVPDELKSMVKNRETELFKIAVEHEVLQPALREHLLDAAVAVKLCIRTFQLT